MLVKLDTNRITDWNTFHSVFAEAFGFPDFYGRNMNAWIDCMSSLDTSEDGMTTIHVSPGKTAALQLDDVDDFARRCPESYGAVIECASFVNWRKVGAGKPPVLALSFYKTPQAVMCHDEEGKASDDDHVRT